MIAKVFARSWPRFFPVSRRVRSHRSSYKESTVKLICPPSRARRLPRRQWWHQIHPLRPTSHLQPPYPTSLIEHATIRTHRVAFVAATLRLSLILRRLLPPRRSKLIVTSEFVASITLAPPLLATAMRTRTKTTARLGTFAVGAERQSKSLTSCCQLTACTVACKPRIQIDRGSLCLSPQGAQFVSGSLEAYAERLATASIYCACLTASRSCVVCR